MEAHHATLGHRTLEEIRQKRAAERMQKASSGSDLEGSNPYGMQKYESGSQFTEKDFNALLFRLKELEKKNAELEVENGQLQSKLETRQTENDSLLKRVNDLEHESLPVLRKSLKDVSIEKDAAVVAREDLLAQVRTLKKRLKEAEEEQCRAEEDAAALRAELNSLQQQEMRNHYNDMASMDRSADLIKSMKREILDLKSQLQQELLQKQDGQQMLAEEQVRSSSLLAEKQELEERLTAFSKASEEMSKDAASKAFLIQEKEKFEKQLHDMAVMVERLESGRQKLLMEVDSQSSQIEKLYEENSDLSASYNDALGAVAQWESQVKSCLEQNNELREMLHKVRSEQLNAVNVMAIQTGLEPKEDSRNSLDSQGVYALQLKGQLAEEQSRSEALSAEVLRLSAELRRAIQLYNNLTWLYRPILRNIEDGLMRMKHESFVSSQ
ncbi:unnamed protein product [Spirodela intermedia]|uniref:Uncharacterized protein n=1 Tax=Spirodela intermedia TaxID=51605 RepID=A0A7I8K2H1_SPIIN|nr:unnamed protein product [Spirodela intermedia]